RLGRPPRRPPRRGPRRRPHFPPPGSARRIPPRLRRDRRRHVAPRAPARARPHRGRAAVRPRHRRRAPGRRGARSAFAPASIPILMSVAFVTGGSGFVGRNLIPYLTPPGVTVPPLPPSDAPADARKKRAAHPVP